MLTKRALVRAIELPTVEAAIARAERRSSGQIRVSLAPLFWGSVRRAAERTFDRLEIGSTRGRNGVLIFVAPARRQFVVLGDRGIDELVGPQLWDEVGVALGVAFAEGRYTQGLTHAIETIGEALARHFPAESGDSVNELDDTVDLRGVFG
ncbi:TPM domain-containing protein [Enhygromyxa salina]|uniref:TPM domain-containing protein n=1 Tax=Enhygromyxa salina TaxID=215803 RepID=A0A2S9YYD9_9BACT|nr:TPM domain-containing protein [Enhygromyxa salina]PRQ10108.1 hypothetical protein ENSA7_01530 [Enhygromyxa salina]